jgi:glycosyltransferase involved in cell wall biosynthesis
MNKIMKDLPISVIIPIYNAETFLSETINSVLSQTFSDFELLALDDGSTDKSAEIVKSYNDPRIRYIKCDHDFIGTLNKGLALSRGKYIAQIDHDDMMLPYRLQTQYDFMEANPDIVGCGGYMTVFGRISCEIKAFLTYSDIVKGFIMADIAPIYNSTGFFRRNILEKYNIEYKRGYSFAADMKFWSDIVKIGKIVNIPKPLILYRTSDTQTSIVTISESRKAIEVIYMEMLQYILSGLPENDSFISSIKEQFIPILDQMIDLSFFSTKLYRMFISEIIEGLCKNGFLNLDHPLRWIQQ